jgi:hypothetical protein
MGFTEASLERRVRPIGGLAGRWQASFWEMGAMGLLHRVWRSVFVKWSNEKGLAIICRDVEVCRGIWYVDVEAL